MILLTGATGFIGQAVLQRLQQDNSKTVIAAVRANNHQNLPAEVLHRSIPSLEKLHTENIAELFKDVSVVIHCAARAHVMQETEENPIDIYRRINVEGTLNLAQQAAKAGVRRFVFISSIKVNGEWTTKNQPFQENSLPNPQDAYGISKLEAEKALLDLAAQTTMDVVIIRPPLVYGPGVKGNFATMVRWVRRGVPLPFGAIENQRSLIALDNLVDFIVLCANIEATPKASNQIFLISDGEDVSTSDLLRKIAMAYNVPVRLLPIPEKFMRTIANILGKKALTDRLFGSLIVDNNHAQTLLGWKPIISMDEQLKKMAFYDKNI